MVVRQGEWNNLGNVLDAFYDREQIMIKKIVQCIMCTTETVGRVMITQNVQCKIVTTCDAMY